MGYKMAQLCSSSWALQGQYTHKMFYYIKKKSQRPLIRGGQLPQPLSLTGGRGKAFRRIC